MDSKSNSLSLDNLLLPEVLSDPYPFYHRLRSQAPIHWDCGTWVLSCHADVVTALRDPRLSARRLPDAEVLQNEWQPTAPLFQMLSRQMLFQDPPDHSRLRGLVNKAFTPRMVEGMRPRVQRLVDELLDEACASGHMEVIADLASPLPIVVIAEMMGVPTRDRARLKKWSDDLATFLGGIDIGLEQTIAIAQSVTEAIDYFREIAAEHRGAPRNDLVSALLEAEEQGDALNEEEVLSNCLLLLLAGHETTTNLIGNGLMALIRNPDQKRLLQDDPMLIPNAVEELLRFDSPVQGTSRIAREPLEIGGHSIQRGDPVMVLLGAANRDPAVFADPDRLDIRRSEIRHLAFGQGIHFCVGAALARLEGQIALGTLINRLPGIRLETDMPLWRDNQILRGLVSLPIIF